MKVINVKIVRPWSPAATSDRGPRMFSRLVDERYERDDHRERVLKHALSSRFFELPTNLVLLSAVSGSFKMAVYWCLQQRMKRSRG